MSDSSARSFPFGQNDDGQAEGSTRSDEGANGQDKPVRALARHQLLPSFDFLTVSVLLLMPLMYPTTTDVPVSGLAEHSFGPKIVPFLTPVTRCVRLESTH